MGTGANEVSDEVTLQDYWRVVVAGKSIILVAIVAAAVIGLALTFIRSTTYSASSTVFLGQATTLSGTPLTTPPTNPATAPVVLEGDEIVQPVADATGLSVKRVRSGIALDVPRAPGAAGNLPTLVTVTYTGSKARIAVEVVNRYAQEIVAYNSRTFDIGQETFDSQLERYRAEETQLRAQIESLQRQLAGAAGSSREPSLQLALALAGERLSDTVEQISTIELTKANRLQIEEPRVVTAATGASSSTSGPRRLRTVVFAGLLGAVVGLILVFIWRRPRDEGA